MNKSKHEKFICFGILGIAIIAFLSSCGGTRKGVEAPIAGSEKLRLEASKLGALLEKGTIKFAENSPIIDDESFRKICKNLSGLASLKKMDLSNSGLKANSVRHLAMMRLVEELTVEDIEFSPECASIIEAMPSLRTFRLEESTIHEGALRNLHGNSGSAISYLEVRNCVLPKEASTDIAQLRDLQSLCVADSNWSDEDTKIVAELSDLEFLDLYNTGISDNALHGIVNLKKLEELNLSGTKVSIEGLKSLKSLKALRRLCLYKNNLSMQDVEQIRGFLPSVTIFYEGDLPAGVVVN